MTDDRIGLDGRWDFLHVGQDVGLGPAEVRSIQVPGPWQAQFADLRMRGGTGIYRRSVEVPSRWKRDRVYLRFGAVFHITKAWVNGAHVGTHEGGFLPFAFDVTEELIEGINEIKVRADSPTDDPHEYPETPFAEIAFGKQSWYGPLSGIWQSVWLECRPADHLARLRVRPELQSGRVRVSAFLQEPALEDSDLELTVTRCGSFVTSAKTSLPRGSSDKAIELMVADPLSWSPDAPNLYELTAKVVRAGRSIDQHRESFGFRTIETRDGRFFLNGEPIYLRGALDQDYYPEGICTTPSIAFLEDQFRKAKELGLNCVRCHIKAPDPRYYEAADRIGLLVWTELPNMGISTERSRSRKEAILKGIVDRDGNHASIFCWTIINENWGVDLVHDPDHRAWLRRTYRWLKEYDPGRLVVDNSPLAPSFHIETDIADYHFYAAIPDSRQDWDRFVDALASRAEFLFAPAGEAVQRGDEPLVCSEFGNWGLPHPDALKDARGHEPWWFETGHDWGEGVMYAHGIENRFTDWSLARVFGDLSGFVEAAQWQQFRALKYEIEAMRARPEIAGYVITELTDAHWECNGLLDMRRNIRTFHSVFGQVNADTVIVPKCTRRSVWAGESASVEVSIAHGGRPALPPVRLEIDGTARSSTRRQEPGTVAELGVCEIEMPAVAEPCMREIPFVLRAANGTVLAQNALRIAVHPRRQRNIRRALWSPDPRVRDHLGALGYVVSSAAQEDALWVQAEPDGVAAAHVRKGGRLLLLPQAPCALYPFFPHWQNVRVADRDGTLWRGDWASTFAWLRRGRAFASLPGGPLLDEPFERVLPRQVICGCNLLDFQARVHAAMVVGWIHKPVALVVERSYGNGRFVASTFRLFEEEAGLDPTATVLLDALVDLALAEGSAASREREVIAADFA